MLVEKHLRILTMCPRGDGLITLELVSFRGVGYTCWEGIPKVNFSRGVTKYFKSSEVTPGIMPTQDEVCGEAEYKIQCENTDG
jgi:hypothetical protein